MRSNDAWLGLPYDVAQFTMLQEAVAAHWGLALGRYVHIDGSLHLYERDMKAARAIVEEHEPRATVVDNPPMRQQDFEMTRSEALDVLVRWWAGGKLPYQGSEFFKWAYGVLTEGTK
jgi:thymidylate synthase